MNTQTQAAEEQANNLYQQFQKAHGQHGLHALQSAGVTDGASFWEMYSGCKYNVNAVAYQLGILN